MSSFFNFSYFEENKLLIDPFLFLKNNIFKYLITLTVFLKNNIYIINKYISRVDLSSTTIFIYIFII